MYNPALFSNTSIAQEDFLDSFHFKNQSNYFSISFDINKVEDFSDPLDLEFTDLMTPTPYHGLLNFDDLNNEKEWFLVKTTTSKNNECDHAMSSDCELINQVLTVPSKESLPDCVTYQRSVHTQDEEDISETPLAIANKMKGTDTNNTLLR